MDNIFTLLTNKLPQATKPEQPASIKSTAELPIKDLVASWQKAPSSELSSELLRRLQPTMTAAIKTYAPNTGGKFEIKAAKLALSALSKYDPSHGTEPSTFVFNNLKRLSRLNSRSSNVLQQSEAMALDKKRVLDAQASFEDDNDREPSLDELADLTGLSRKKIDNILSNADNTIVNESSTLSEDTRKDTFARSTLTDDDYFDYVYASVSPIDQKIMEWTSGLHGKPTLSNNAIAARLKISPAAISQRKVKLQRMLSDVRALL